MVQINWTSQASEDLRKIYDYISADSFKYAKLQVVRIKNRTQILKKQIYSGHPVPELRKKDIRQVLEGRYRVIYRVVNDTRVDILTVHHSYRNFDERIS